jgi:hypothetical protein
MTVTHTKPGQTYGRSNGQQGRFRKKTGEKLKPGQVCQLIATGGGVFLPVMIKSMKRLNVRPRLNYSLETVFQFTFNPSSHDLVLTIFSLFLW